MSAALSDSAGVEPGTLSILSLIVPRRPLSPTTVGRIVVRPANMHTHTHTHACMHTRLHAKILLQQR